MLTVMQKDSLKLIETDRILIMNNPSTMLSVYSLKINNIRSPSMLICIKDKFLMLMTDRTMLFLYKVDVEQYHSNIWRFTTYM